MKKLVMTAAVLACAASVVQAQVSSANIVGYGKIATTDDDYTLGGVQFVVSADNSISEILGDNMPIGSKAYIWGGSGYAIPEYMYLTENVFIGGSVTNGIGWSVDGATVADISMPAGSGFWLVAPAGATGGNEVIVSGEVELADSVTNTVPANFSMLANPYPTEVAVTNMGFSATLGDKIYIWGGSGYTIPEYQYLTENVFIGGTVTNGIGWSVDGATETGVALGVGQGFWYDSQAVGDVEWVMDRPFTP